jgi:hypothetical protein
MVWVIRLTKEKKTWHIDQLKNALSIQTNHAHVHLVASSHGQEQETLGIHIHT